MTLPIYGPPDNGDIGGSPPVPPPDNVAGVSSVNTRVGAVVITATDVGLGSVNNTSDANKPISTALAAALSVRDTQISTINSQLVQFSSSAVLD